MKQQRKLFVTRVALIVALGGFLMGFDASVISGVIGFIESEFDLNKTQLGFSVSSLALVAMFAMLGAGPISNIIGRKKTLSIAALLYLISAVGSALAPDYITLVAARMIGGIGVGASLIIAPMYIAEMAPPAMRGRMVSFNQLNIVVGLSAAFFTNYLIQKWSSGGAEWAHNMGIVEHPWRWMLGLEAVPALMYFFALFLVPRSPRWLAMKNHFEEALAVMRRALPEQDCEEELAAIRESLNEEQDDSSGFRMQNVLDAVEPVFSKGLRPVLMVGIAVAVLQQLVGINAVFFYAPMIFEQSGIGEDASFAQAILVGLINLVFTLLAMALIDRVGRRPLLLVGLLGITLTMGMLAYGFGEAKYHPTAETVQTLPEEVSQEAIAPLIGQVYNSDVAFKAAFAEVLEDDVARDHEGSLISAAIQMNPVLILIGILGFVACFAFSLGPVMWVLLSELFPNNVRAVAISVVGFVNSLISWLVQQVFPLELAVLGSSTTFLLFGVFAAIGLLICWRIVPETKGKSLEELEKELSV